MYIFDETGPPRFAENRMLLSAVSLCMLVVAAAQDADVVSYAEYQLLRVYPSTVQQLQRVLDLAKRKKYEGLVSIWSQNLLSGRTSGNNRSEISADILSAPQVLEDLVEQLDSSGFPYDVLIHNLEVRKALIHFGKPHSRCYPCFKC